jgi:hypothetical protein
MFEEKELRTIFGTKGGQMQDFKSTIFFKIENSTISLPVKWAVCEKSTFLILYVTKGAVNV